MVFVCALLTPALIAVAVMLFGPWGVDERPHVVVCIDTLRADHTSVYGYERDTTPHLARIAADGLVLRSHYANATWTKPSVASMLTGLHPTAHGSREGQFINPRRDRESRAVDALSDKHDTLAEVFGEAGYVTGAHVTNINMLPKFGYAQGYDDYNFVRDATAVDHVNASDREAIAYARRNLADARKPQFVWVHIMSVHQYTSPAPSRPFACEAKTPIDRDAPAHGRVRDYEFLEDAVTDYDNSIHFVDGLVGELFDFVQNEVPNTVLCVTSDHGEEFYEHGGFEYGTTVYDEMVRIPGVFHGPLVPRGEVAGFSDSLDLFPSLLAIAGVTDAAERLPHGQRLFEGGVPSPGKEPVFAEQHDRTAHRRHTGLDGSGKFIRRQHKKTGEERFEFYSEAGRIEGENEFAGLPEGDSERYRGRLSDFESQARRWFEKYVGVLDRSTVGLRDFEAFRSLGYAGTSEVGREDGPLEGSEDRSED
ncbi:MAG: sulfatase [bacterium]|nr:sulfatase [bacterium]